MATVFHNVLRSPGDKHNFMILFGYPNRFERSYWCSVKYFTTGPSRGNKTLIWSACQIPWDKYSVWPWPISTYQRDVTEPRDEKKLAVKHYYIVFYHTDKIDLLYFNSIDYDKKKPQKT